MHSPLPTKPVFTQSKVEPKRQASRQPRFTFWAGLALMVIILAVAVLYARGVFVQAAITARLLIRTGLFPGQSPMRRTSPVESGLPVKSVASQPDDMTSARF